MAICYFYVIVVFSIVSGCINSVKKSNNNYIKSLDIARVNFSDSMINHFPDAVGDTFKVKLKLPNGKIKSDRYGFILLIKSSRQMFFGFKKNFASSSFKKVSFSDKYTIIIDSVNIIDDDIDVDSLVAIPNIPKILKRQYNRPKIRELIMDHYDFYVIESSTESILEKEYLTEGKGLPKEWKNGYSKGIAINEIDNELIYWLEAW